MSRRAARRRDKKQQETTSTAEPPCEANGGWSNATFSSTKKEPKQWERGLTMNATPLMKQCSTPTATTTPAKNINPFSVGATHPDAINSKPSSSTTTTATTTTTTTTRFRTPTTSRTTQIYNIFCFFVHVKDTWYSSPKSISMVSHV